MKSEKKSIHGDLVDLITNEIYGAQLTIEDGIIKNIEHMAPTGNGFLVPGFVDAHVHIESSMLTPRGFAKEALRHGTIGAIADPHEIANVLGVEGIEYMIEDAADIPFYFRFAIPACVPCSIYETSGAQIGLEEMKALISNSNITHMGEVMDFPGVINGEALMTSKLKLAAQNNLPIDGHFPGGRGADLKSYADLGITTDHECIDIEEALEKIKAGMKILIREGSAARNFEALHPLLKIAPREVMFCCDDLHPSSLKQGHINLFVKRALSLGYNLYDVLRAASLNQAKHYKMNIGMLQKGDSADFLVIDNLKDFNIKSTFVKGKRVYDSKIVNFNIEPSRIVNKFRDSPVSIDDFKITPQSDKLLRVIKCLDGELFTLIESHKPLLRDSNVVSDTENDVLKMSVTNRYSPEKPALAFIKGINLKRGAIAMSVAHDSHNIISVGCTDKEMARAVNLVIEMKGGIVVIDQDKEIVLPLEVAGLMSNKPLDVVDKLYHLCDTTLKEMGSTLEAPQMTIAFMSLVVIPKLKLSDKGLFDVDALEFVDLFI